MINNIQVLRAVAAMMIVFIHSTTLLKPFEVAPAAWLFAGVDIFFVISGFIMVHVARTRQQAPGAFIVDRLIRIVPVYWLFTLTVFAAILLVPGLGGWTASPLDLARSLLFVPYGAPQHFSPLVYVGWSLNIEMYFYALFAVGIAAARTLPARVAVISGLIAVPVALGHFLPAGSPLQLYALPIVFEFVLGMLLALAYPRLIRAPLASGIAAMVTGAALIITDPMRGFTLDTFVRFAFPAALLVGGALVSEARGARITWRPALEIGAASYVLYIAHPLVVSAFNNVQERISPLSTPAGAIAWFAAAVLAAITFAWLVHRLFERPVTRRLKQLFDIRRAVHQPDLVG